MRSSKVVSVIATLAAIALVVMPVAEGACVQEIVVANKVVARIVAPGEFGSVSRRAAKIDQRIAQAISVEDVGSPKMSVRQASGVPTIFIGKTMLMRVYPEDAKRYNVSPAQIAKQWAGNLARQFPLAEPCIHMGKGAAASELARAQARAAAAANVKVPPQDWAIVAVVLDHIARSRVLAAPVFERELPAITKRIHEDIKQNAENLRQGKPLPTPPHAPGTCPQPGGCPACRSAKAAAVGGSPSSDEGISVPPVVERRIEGGLKLMRIVNDQRYRRDRAMVAWTIVKAARKQLVAH